MAKAEVNRKKKTKAEKEEDKADSVLDNHLGQRRVLLLLDEEDEDAVDAEDDDDVEGDEKVDNADVEKRARSHRC